MKKDEQLFGKSYFPFHLELIMKTSSIRYWRQSFNFGIEIISLGFKDDLVCFSNSKKQPIWTNPSKKARKCSWNNGVVTRNGQLSPAAVLADKNGLNKPLKTFDYRMRGCSYISSWTNHVVSIFATFLASLLFLVSLLQPELNVTFSNKLIEGTCYRQILINDHNKC